MLLMTESCSFRARIVLRRLEETQRRIALFIIVLALSFSAALPQAASHSKAQRQVTAAVKKTLEQGKDAILPPHISNLLGISPSERAVSVKQFAQIGEVVKGFDVSTANHEHVVIFVEHPAAKQSTFYLALPSGRVRRVVVVEAGVGHARAPTAKDKKAFEIEKQYWLDLLESKRP